MATISRRAAGLLLGGILVVGLASGCRNANPYADSDPLARNAPLIVHGVEDHDAYVHSRLTPNLDFRGGSGALTTEPSQYVLTVQGVTTERDKMEIRRQVHDFRKRTWFRQRGGETTPMKPVVIRFDTDKPGDSFAAVPSGNVNAISAAMAAKVAADEAAAKQRDADRKAAGAAGESGTDATVKAKPKGQVKPRD